MKDEVVPGAGFEPATRGFSIRHLINEIKDLPRELRLENINDFKKLVSWFKPSPTSSYYLLMLKPLPDHDFLAVAMELLSINGKSVMSAVRRELKRRFDVQSAPNKKDTRKAVLSVLEARELAGSARGK